MAQRAQDPQQQVYPGSDHFHAMPFGHVQAQDSSNLLDNTEQNFMTDFFANPDQAINQHGMEDENQFSMEGIYNPFIYMREARALTNESPDHTFYNSNSNYGTANDGPLAGSTMASNGAGNMDHSSWGNFSAANTAATSFQDPRALGQQQHHTGLQSYPGQEGLFQPPPTWQQPVHGNHLPFQHQQRSRHLSIDTHQSPHQHASMQGSRSALPGSHNRPALMHFGTDNNFSQSGYQAPGFQRVKDRSGDLLDMPFAADAKATMHSSSSSTPTRQVNGLGNQQYNASREGHSGLPTPNSAQNAASWGNLYQHPASASNDDDAQNSAARKRRRGDGDDGFTDPIPGKVQAQQSQEDEYTSNSAGLAKRRKSAHARLGGNSPRSPASSGGEDEGDDQPSSSKKKDKKPRQNLSDTQKRQNHIMSEKKRRELIKTGYADLNELVPALYGGKTGMSRSESLFECQTYLESLIMGSQSVMRALSIDANHAALVNIRTTSDFAVKSENNYIE